MPLVPNCDQRKEKKNQLVQCLEECIDIIMSAPIGFFRSTPEGRFLVANPALAKICGFSNPEELIDTIADIGTQLYVQPEDRVEFQRQIEFWGEVKNFECQVFRQDGSIIWVSVNAQVLRDSEGSITEYQGYTTEVTARKLFEEKQKIVKEEYAKVFHSTQDAMFLVEVDDSGGFRYLRNNLAHQTATGFSCDDIRGRTPQELVGEELGNIVAANYTRCVQQAAPICYEETLELPAGKRTWQTTLTPVFQDSQVGYIVGSSLDITERKQAEQALEYERTFLSTVLDNIQEAIVICDHEGRIVRFNEAARKLHGIAEKPIPSSQWAEFYGLYKPDMITLLPEQEIPLYRALQGESFQDVEIVVVSENGTYHVMACNGRPLIDEQGRINGAVVSMFDITERKRTEDQLKYLSFHDPLTGLYNRAYLENELQRLCRSREYPICIISMDLDGMKLVNDTLGHEQGDIQLKVCARILQESFRASDIVARIGGDEFAALLPKTDMVSGDTIASRIRSAVENYNKESKDELPLSLSLGLACAEDTQNDLTDALKQADDRMYKDKLNKQVNTKVRIMNSHLAALEERDFFYQGHARRVEELGLQLGQKIDLSHIQLMDIALLAQVHDLGYVNIPDEILFKPGPLTEQEWEIMCQHPEKGFRIAQASKDLAGIADLILKHHERWDGRGYPLGLKGEEIPIECRILAIADAFDVMTSDRPYKKAISTEEAVQELKSCAGIQFDPGLVNEFLKILANNSAHSRE